MTALPPALTAAIEAEMHGVPASTLARAVDALSLRYREAGAAARLAGFSDADVQAYLAYRLPATYAAVSAALDATAESLPDWEPQSLLDAGSGPGTAAWSAVDIWPSIQNIVLVDRDARLIAAGQRLARAAAEAALRTADWCRQSLAAPEPLPRSDLVVAAYTLGELAPDAIEGVVGRLWEACTGAVVLVEPGTPQGYALLQQLRGLLQQQGAHTLAPCPHEQRCPLLGTARWCHFQARLERSRLHRLAKRSELAYEDEPFAYVAMARFPPEPYWARVVGRPRGGHGHIELELCTEEGVNRTTVSRRDGAYYRTARKVRWGDALVGPETDEP